MWQPKRASDLVESEGRTRVWIARFCGVTPQTIYNFLSGRSNPPPNMVKLLALALNTSEAYLMGEELIQAKGQEVMRTGT